MQRRFRNMQLLFKHMQHVFNTCRLRTLCFASKMVPPAAGKTSPSPIHVTKIKKHLLLPNRRLGRPVRPHQARYMSQKSRKAIVARNTSPVAAGNTSPSPIHVAEIQERICLPEKCACGSREDLTRLDYIKSKGCHICNPNATCMQCQCK